MSLWQRLCRNADGSALLNVPDLGPILLLVAIGWAVWTALS